MSRRTSSAAAPVALAAGACLVWVGASVALVGIAYPEAPPSTIQTISRATPLTGSSTPVSGAGLGHAARAPRAGTGVGMAVAATDPSRVSAETTAAGSTETTATGSTRSTTVEAPSEVEERVANNRVEEGLAQRLAELGIEHELVRDDDGWAWVDCDDSVASVWVAVDQYYREQDPPTRGEIIDLNDEADALAAFLDARGVPYRIVTDPFGIRDLIPEPEDEAAAAAIDDYWWEVEPPTAGELQEWNDESHVLAAFLDERGIEHQLVTDSHGWVDVDYDESDDTTVDAVDEFYEDYDPYGWWEDEE